MTRETTTIPGGLAIEVRTLGMVFGGLVVFDGLTLEVKQGERLGIIGPNGAGKSTLFNLLTALIRPTSGSITVNGSELVRLRPWAIPRAGIGRTFQIPRPFARLSLTENLMVALTHGGRLRQAAARDRAIETLRSTGFKGREDALAGNLGILDLKRLELARALSLNPKVLLLDEIAGGLTNAECDTLLGILDENVRPTTTVVWIEHVLHALRRYVKEAAVLAEGRIVARGPIAQLVDNADVRRLYFGEETA
jgi:branched-chain amino acid transport system ATP-binding protein